MNSILQIKDNIVIIGDTKTNSIIEVRTDDCNFEPTVGDKVNIFSNESKVFVTKVLEEIPPPLQKQRSLDERININIVNDNSHRNDYASPIMVEGAKNVVNKTVYLLLAFFVGGFGFHKFYSGRIGLGILYLLFCWTYIPSIIAFIEFIIACFKPADSQGRIVI